MGRQYSSLWRAYLRNDRSVPKRSFVTKPVRPIKARTISETNFMQNSGIWRTNHSLFGERGVAKGQTTVVLHGRPAV